MAIVKSAAFLPRPSAQAHTLPRMPVPRGSTARRGQRAEGGGRRGQGAGGRGQDDGAGWRSAGHHDDVRQRSEVREHACGWRAGAGSSSACTSLGDGVACACWSGILVTCPAPCGTSARIQATAPRSGRLEPCHVKQIQGSTGTSAQQRIAAIMGPVGLSLINISPISMEAVAYLKHTKWPLLKASAHRYGAPGTPFLWSQGPHRGLRGPGVQSSDLMVGKHSQQRGDFAHILTGAGTRA